MTNGNTMNETKLFPDDPRLTAYALGELEGDEHAAVEAALQTDATARAAVEEIRATARQLEAALASEPEIISPPLKAKHVAPYTPARKLVHFPYWAVAGLAAAGFAVMLALRPMQVVRVAEQEKAAAAPAGAKQSQLADAALKKSEAVAAEAKPTAYDQVTFPAPSIPAGRIELQAKPPEMAEADQKDALTGSIAPNAPAEEETIAMSKLQVSAAPAHGYSASETMTGSRVTTDIAGVNNSVPCALPSRATPVALNAKFVAGGHASNDPMRGFLYQDHAFDAPANSGGQLQAPAGSDEPRYFKAEPFGGKDLWSAGQNPSSTFTFNGNERQNFNTEAYAYHADSDFLSVAQNPLSTFALDVDTASYANVRRFLQAGEMPPADAVRIEELVNYFPYAYATPRDNEPLAATLEVAAAPWAPTHRLVRIGLKAREVTAAARPVENLVFLIDVSGSMDEANKLPLVQQSLRLLLDQLRPDDRVAIVIYAGESGLALPSTPASHRREILEALDALHAGGSTNGARGLELAYDIAKANFITDGVNRVILATDGDFNVGVTSEGGLVRLVEEKARSGVALTALGFGTGNYKDEMFKQLADKGHGNYGYVDTLEEAKKLLVEQVGGTLVTVAKDVKVQVEFNPAKVQSYRLIGYDDRMLKKEDFNHDAITAGDVGAGHTVTALYEIVPAGVEPPATPGVDALKYQKVETGNQMSEVRDQKAGDLKSEISNPEILTVKVRYTPIEGGAGRRLEFPLTDRGEAFSEASMDFKFAAAVAGFGLILRNSPDKGSATLAEVEEWAGQGLGPDAGGYRAEFIGLVHQAEKLKE
jgi:Ca-activated chloride channel family protein